MNNNHLVYVFGSSFLSVRINMCDIKMKLFSFSLLCSMVSSIFSFNSKRVVESQMQTRGKITSTQQNTQLSNTRKCENVKFMLCKHLLAFLFLSISPSVCTFTSGFIIYSLHTSQALGKKHTHKTLEKQSQMATGRKNRNGNVHSSTLKQSSVFELQFLLILCLSLRCTILMCIRKVSFLQCLPCQCSMFSLEKKNISRS